MELAVLLMALLIVVAITCLPLVLFRHGIFASDQAVESQLAADRRQAARVAQGNPATLAARLEDARELREHRRLRDFAFTLTILPGLLAVGAILLAVLAGALVIVGGAAQR